jgi:hypothetical protein
MLDMVPCKSSNAGPIMKETSWEIYKKRRFASFPNEEISKSECLNFLTWCVLREVLKMPTKIYQMAKKLRVCVNLASST